MAQYRNLIKTIRNYPTYSWNEDLATKQDAFIRSLKLGEIFKYPEYANWEKIAAFFQERGVVIQKNQFKIKRLQKDYPHTAIVVEKDGKLYQHVIEEPQKFDPNLIFKEGA